MFSTKYNKSLVAVYIGTDYKLHLELKDADGNRYEPLVSDYAISLNKWNFFNLNWMNRDDGLGYSNVCEYELTLNCRTKVYQKVDPRLDVEVKKLNAEFHIGLLHYVK